MPQAVPQAVPGAPPGDSDDHGGGVIFGCTNETHAECMARQLLGLPTQHMRRIQSIVPHHTALFLFNYSQRTLHGVYEATGPGALNLEPDAWTAAVGGKGGKGSKGGRGGKGTVITRSLLSPMANGRSFGGGSSPFPAQVRFQVVHEFPPLHESRFQHIVTYKGQNQFEFLLTASQVQALMSTFIDLQDSGE